MIISEFFWLYRFLVLCFLFSFASHSFVQCTLLINHYYRFCIQQIMYSPLNIYASLTLSPTQIVHFVLCMVRAKCTSPLHCCSHTKQIRAKSSCSKLENWIVRLDRLDSLVSSALVAVRSTVGSGEHILLSAKWCLNRGNKIHKLKKLWRWLVDPTM
jgi:hypothetical protein